MAPPQLVLPKVLGLPEVPPPVFASARVSKGTRGFPAAVPPQRPWSSSPSRQASRPHLPRLQQRQQPGPREQTRLGRLQPAGFELLEAAVVSGVASRGKPAGQFVQEDERLLTAQRRRGDLPPLQEAEFQHAGGCQRLHSPAVSSTTPPKDPAPTSPSALRDSVLGLRARKPKTPPSRSRMRAQAPAAKVGGALRAPGQASEKLARAAHRVLILAPRDLAASPATLAAVAAEGPAAATPAAAAALAPATVREAADGKEAEVQVECQAASVPDEAAAGGAFVVAPPDKPKSKAVKALLAGLRSGAVARIVDAAEVEVQATEAAAAGLEAPPAQATEAEAAGPGAVPAQATEAEAAGPGAVPAQATEAAAAGPEAPPAQATEAAAAGPEAPPAQAPIDKPSREREGSFESDGPLFDRLQSEGSQVTRLQSLTPVMDGVKTSTFQNFRAAVHREWSEKLQKPSSACPVDAPDGFLQAYATTAAERFSRRPAWASPPTSAQQAPGWDAVDTPQLRHPQAAQHCRQEGREFEQRTDKIKRLIYRREYVTASKESEAEHVRAMDSMQRDGKVWARKMKQSFEAMQDQRKDLYETRKMLQSVVADADYAKMKREFRKMRTMERISGAKSMHERAKEVRAGRQLQRQNRMSTVSLSKSKQQQRPSGRRVGTAASDRSSLRGASMSSHSSSSSEAGGSDESFSLFSRHFGTRRRTDPDNSRVMNQKRHAIIVARALAKTSC